MPKFLSGRQKNLKLGVKGYTENENVLDILGRVGVGTSYATEYNVGIGGSVRIDGSVSIGGTLITDYIGVGSVSIANLVVDSISIGNTLGDDGSYIRSTGTGVTWASFPTLRTGFSTVGVSSQTQIITSYNTNFLDIFVNGVLLNASEYQASDGFTITFNDQLNGGEIIDIFSYNTTSNYTGGGGGGGNITIGGDSLWTEAVVGIYTNTNVGINSDYPESALSVTGDVKVLGVITATNFTGDGSGLTNITATGTGVQIRDSGAVVGTAATIDFGDNINVSPISAGVVTVSSSGGGGISGAAGTTGNIQFNNGGPLGADNSFNYDTSQFRLAVNNLQTNVITTTDPTLEINADTEISGILTATQFVGDGSGLTNITATGSGVQVKDSGVTVGTAATIDFGSNLSVDLGSGIATVTAQSSAYANNAGVATIATYTSEWTLGSNSIQDYTFSGPGLTGAEADPTLYLVRGQKYKFTNNMGAHPFRIQSTPNGSAGTEYNDGITNNNISNGTLIWDVQFDAPNKLYYQCTSHGNMGGVIHILDESGSGGITYWSSGSNGIHTTSNVGISTNAASSSYVLDVHGLSRVVGNFVVDDELSVNDNLFVTNVATASTLTLTKDATVGENLTVTKDLTVSRNGNFSGVVTASQFTTQTGGTPTITSPNNLNLNANIVAISTDVTIGRDVLISNNLNVSGVSTFTNLTASSAKLSELTTPHSTTTKNYSVTVASKSDHRYSGGSGNAYYVDGVESPILHLTPGRTYRFTLSSGDMSSHPFRFYLEADKTTPYTTNVTTTATYTEIIITDTTPAVLHYQCSAHGYMGNSVITHSNVVNTPYSITGLNGVNITGVVTATSFSGDGSGLTGVASTDNIITDTVATFNNTTRITGLELAGITTGLNVSGVSTFANDISISGNLTVTDISAANITVAGTVTYDDVTNVDSLGIGTFRQGIDIKTGGANITGVVTATTFSGSGASLTTLNASELDSGTIPDARFPATLPALDGSALTTLNASELDSGTIPDARFPSTLPAVDGSALTGITTTQISGYTGGGGNSIVGDTTPQLGGNLDVNGKDIVSTSNGDIDFAPNGTGAVVFKGVTSNGGNGAGRFKLNCENNSHGITIQGPPHSAAANYTLTLPNDDGGTNTYLKSDGSGNLSWDTPSSGGISGIIVQEEGSSIGTATTINFVGSAVTATMSGGIATVQISSSGGGGGLGNPNTIRTTTRFTATSGQTSFSVTYDVGYVDVFLNGNKLDGTEFTATDGSNVVLTTGAVVDDILEFVAYTGVGLINTTLTTRSTTSYTATSGQTTFAVSYAIGYVDVFQNGVKLDSTEFTATDGSNVVLTTGAIVNDILEFVAYTSIGIASISSSSQGLDVTGQLETDDLNVSGILTATSANFTGNVSIAGTLTYDDVTNVDSIGLITARSGIHVTSGGANITGVVTATTFDGNLTGKVSTGDGFGNGVQIGAGNDLYIYETSSDVGINYMRTGTLFIRSDGDTKIDKGGSKRLLAHATGAVDLYYSDSKKLETTDAGVDVSGYKLAVKDTKADGTGVQLHLWNNSTNNTAGNVWSGIRFTGSTSDYETAEIKGWRVHPGTGLNSLSINTGGVERMVLSSSGVGIGTNSPTAKLEVSGDARVTGILTVGTSSVTINGNTGKVTGISDTQLAAISSSISDTAVDVFVYDTSKDSDGGAWRKRTQNTSWYNETLGTSVRGTRKEFPAVAVFVAESNPNRITIYDGDDPDLPMWMVFTASTNTNANFLAVSGQTLSSIFILNGDLCIGFPSGNGWGVGRVNFLSDSQGWYWTSANIFKQVRNSVAERNDQNGYYDSKNGVSGLANASVNNIAMTVLPNAPIDDATGLPIPTIAAATNGGVSVIKDDGSVVDITQNSPYTQSHNVFFSDYGKILYDNEDTQVVYEVDIPSSDIGYGVYNSISNGRVIYPVGNHGGFSSGEIRLLGSNISNGGRLITKGAFAVDENGATESDYGPVGLSLFDREESNPAKQSLVAYVASDYNTGWMQGDIKGAFLSDTDDTDAVGTELITNGTFDNDITGWITNPFNATYPGSVTWDSGTSTIKVSNPYGTSLLCGIQQTLTNLISGRQYVVTFDVTTGTTGGQYIEVAGQDISYSAVGTYSIYFTPNSSSYGLTFGSNRPGYGIVTYYDNISVKLVEEDRSVNKKGLQVFGTITKSAVATGADLIGYGFGGSASNYLRQPYTSALDFGNGDFSVVYWFKQTTHSDYQDAVNRVDAGQNNGSWLIQHINDGSIQFYVRTSGSYTTYLNSSSSKITDLGWTQIAVVRESGNYVMYFNGKKIATGAGTSSLTVNNAQLQISGRLATNNYPILTGNSISLVRVSSTVPSPEQIKKMYEDEKHLFQENAKATLYGSSDAVTALAFDDTTNLLHVGTSAGRSEFQGLRRINNTTTAVTTAISASNGLIAEQ